MRPRFPTCRDRDKAGEPFIIRAADRRDASAYLVHTKALVGETVYMLKGVQDTLPDLAEQRLIFDYFSRTLTCLCLVASRPSLGLGREPILASLTLTGARTQRTQHTVQLGMGVLREAWGLGIGSALLDAALTWARANPILSRVRLQVYQDNHAARKLYESRGFVDEGVMQDEVLLSNQWVSLIGMSVDTSGEVE
ncbi:MAG: GNAT family N-acetyltransferase [Myxococcota bacterium]